MADMDVEKRRQFLDTRGIAKPSAFSGQDEDWVEFKFVFSSFISLMSEALGNQMAKVETLSLIHI